MSDTPQMSKARITAIEEQFKEDIMLLIKDSPFYGMILLHFTPVVFEGGVAAVDNKKRIWLGYDEPEGGYAKLPTIARKTLLIHEVLHVALDHLCDPGKFNADVANIAKDAVINRIISTDHTLSLDSLPAGVKPNNSSSAPGFTVGWKVYNMPGFNESDWVGIYWWLMDQLENEHKKSGKALQKLIEGLAQGAGKMHGDAKSQDANEMDPTEAQNVQKMRAVVLTSYESCKQQGNLPAEIGRVINKIGESEVPWSYELRELIRTHITNDDFSWCYNSRRAHIGFFPKLKSEALGDVWLALDTSGSMGNEALEKGLGEFRSIRKTTPMGLHFICCDAETYTLQSYDHQEEPEWEKVLLEGGGGTSFVPVFKLIEEKRKEGFDKPACLVFFTDTYGEFPDKEPDYPVIWVTIGGHKVPFGKQIEIKEC